jgi:Adenylate and Guanylate cyclase catalytic domain
MLRFEEHESKFESRVNLQLKYSIIDKSEEFQRKFEFLLNMQGFLINKIDKYKLEDRYFDDENGTIRSLGYTLRIRSGESGSSPYLVTLKSDDKYPGRKGLHRIEEEIPCDEIQQRQFLSDKNFFSTFFPNSNISLKTPLKSTQIINNDRLSIEFSTEVTSWRMSYDLFHYFFEDTGLYSPIFSEVEIERTDYSDDDDPEIASIHGALVEIFGLTEHKVSKAKRGEKFHSSGYPSVANVCVIGFDIIGYSKMTPQAQLNSIQALNKFAKDAISELVSEKFQLICIPTGDGMYVVLEQEIQSITLPFIIKVQNLTKSFIQSFPRDNFKFRTSVHTGPVFRYSDINENLNYAGNGINLAARILNFGSAWHILISKEACELFRFYGANDNLFHDLGEKPIKHGSSVRIFNVFERDFGNPSKNI